MGLHFYALGLQYYYMHGEKACKVDWTQALIFLKRHLLDSFTSYLPALQLFQIFQGRCNDEHGMKFFNK